MTPSKEQLRGEGGTPGCIGEDNSRHLWVPKVEFDNTDTNDLSEERYFGNQTKKSMLASDFKEQYKKKIKKINILCPEHNISLIIH